MRPAEEGDADLGRERAFLLRGWPDGEGGWRFNLEAIGRQPERVGFTTLEEVVAFLQAAFPAGDEGRVDGAV